MNALLPEGRTPTVIHVLPASDYRYLPAILWVEPCDQELPEPENIALSDATVAELRRAIEVQRSAVEGETRRLQALTNLLAIRMHQGVPDNGPAWDETLVRGGVS